MYSSGAWRMEMLILREIYGVFWQLISMGLCRWGYTGCFPLLLMIWWTHKAKGGFINADDQRHYRGWQGRSCRNDERILRKSCLPSHSPWRKFSPTITAAIEKSPLARILVLEETDQSPAERITGYANLAITWNNEAGGIQVWFDELFFKSNARGKGYGTEVFQWLEKEYPQARRIRLEVTHENTRAISLYERLGYEELPYYQMIKDRV